jgi:hypothetical protein
LFFAASVGLLFAQKIIDMQTPTRLIVLFLVLSCGLLAVSAEGTLHVDNIVPSSTNSVLLQQLETDHMIVTEANIRMFYFFSLQTANQVFLSCRHWCLVNTTSSRSSTNEFCCL